MTTTTYTAMLTDGPLEGKTLTAKRTDGGDAQPRLSIPGTQKQYIYVRGRASEFAGSEAGQATAIEYRYLESVTA